MIRQTTKYFVDKAIEDELHYAVTERPMFHSDHEAWAVLNEELEEYVSRGHTRTDVGCD